jgi:hypothetical protein
MIIWREKLIATAIHFLVTLALAGMAAALIFLLWYPDPYDDMIGGTKLFLLIVISDLALGPLMSLVVYNSRKSRRELLLDYGIVGAIQIAALVYGISIMADARPVYLAFHGDRFEVVLSGDLRRKELDAAKDPRHRQVRWTGPALIGVQVPPEERNDALFQALEGNPEHQRPRYYLPYESQLALIRRQAKPLAELEMKKPGAKRLIDAELHDGQLPRDRLGWLPVSHFRGFWTAIVDLDTGKPVAYIDLDPY